MKKNYKSMVWLLIGCVSILCMCACANQNSESDSTNDKIQSNAGFDYPDKEDFKFNVKIQKSKVNKGESFVINCNLKNDTKKNYYIEHGLETITYNYNNSSEQIDAIAVLDTFESGDVIKRDLNIEAVKSGMIIVTACIRVKPAKYSDVYETYSYSEQLDVVVQ